MLKSDKRGISVMIGYILLIAMAVSLSILVFNWMAHYVPDNDPSEEMCPDGVSVTLKKVVCDSTNTDLSFTIKNNGLFSISGFSIHVNDQKGSTLGVYPIEETGAPISPEGEHQFSYNYRDHVDGLIDPIFESNLQLVEVRPFFLIDGSSVVCPSIRETLVCDVRPEVCIGGDDEDRDGFVDCFDSDCAYSSFCSENDVNIFLHVTFDNPAVPFRDHSSYKHTVVGYGSDLSYSSTGGYNDDGTYYLEDDASIELLDNVTAISLGDSFSLSALIKPDENGNSNARLFSRECSSYFCTRIDQDTLFPHSLDYITDRSNEALDHAGSLAGNPRWYHVVSVWDASVNVTTYYVNGVEVNTTLYHQDFDTLANFSLVFGSDIGAGNVIPGTTGNTFTGFVDDIIIYDTFLTASDISNMFNYYNQTGCGFETDCP